MPQYAAPGDVSAYAGIAVDKLPPTITIQLRRTSNLVAAAVAGAVYDTTPDGYPRDATLRGALLEATCAHVSSAVLANVVVGGGRSQLGDRVASKSALGVSIAYQLASRADLETLAAGQQLTNEAWGILSRAGLISAAVSGTTSGSGVQTAAAGAYDPTSGRLVG